MPGPESHRNHAAVVEHYARIAPKYDARWDRYTRRTLSTAIEQIEPALPDGGRLLDVACGTGRLEEMLLPRRPDVRIMGVDLSPEMIEIAQSRRLATPGDDSQLHWHVAPAERVPAEDESFDVVACNNAFHLIPDATASLREFHRVLKPGGRLVIVDWCREFFTIAALIAIGRPFDRQSRRVETVTELAGRLERAGFRAMHRQKFRATWFWGLMCVAGERTSTRSPAARG